MDFEWTPAQLELRESVVEFGSRLNDGLDERESEGHFPRDLWEACAEFGIQSLPLPGEYGGMGADLLTTMVAMEGLGYACQDQGLLFSIHAHMWAVQHPIEVFGTEEQKRRYLPKLCDGTWIGAHCMSEPDSGSDAFALRTRATADDDQYILNGTKTFVTNGPVADVFVAFATVDPSRGMWGVTGFLVEKGTPGLEVTPPFEKMGLRTSPMAEVIFEDCRVPADNVLGRVGQGSAVFNSSMAWERACILGSTVGAMERQLETAVRYAKERRQFGKPIGNFQLVASKIADMKVRLETARLLLYHAAWAQQSQGGSTLESAMAKLHISQVAAESALDAIQVHGGYGYMREFGVERELRDVLGGRLYSGTSEILKLLIARSLGLSPDN